MSTNNDFNFFTVLIAILTILGFVGASAVSIGNSYGVKETMNNSERNTFKNEALTMIDAAQNMYSELSMSTQDSYEYTKSSTDNEYVGMCVTLDALVKNGYLDKDITNYGGVFLVEIPYDGGATIYMSWVHNGELGINGIEKNDINKLKMEGSSKGSESISGGEKALTNNLTGIKKQISNVEKNNTVTITSPESRGGTGSTYDGIKCVKNRLS